MDLSALMAFIPPPWNILAGVALGALGMWIKNRRKVDPAPVDPSKPVDPNAPAPVDPAPSPDILPNRPVLNALLKALRDMLGQGKPLFGAAGGPMLAEEKDIDFQTAHRIMEAAKSESMKL